MKLASERCILKLRFSLDLLTGDLATALGQWRSSEQTVFDSRNSVITRETVFGVATPQVKPDSERLQQVNHRVEPREGVQLGLTERYAALDNNQQTEREVRCELLQQFVFVIEVRHVLFGFKHSGQDVETGHDNNTLQELINDRHH